MYAITWNSTGDKMIQVGIEPVRLLAEIKQNDVSTVVSNMPMYQGMNLYVADLDTHEILGATDENTIGKKLEAIGMPRAYLGGTKMVSGIVKIHGEKYNCVFEPLGEYLVGVTFAVSADNESNLIAILMVALYPVSYTHLTLPTTHCLFRPDGGTGDRKDLPECGSENA